MKTMLIRSLRAYKLGTKESDNNSGNGNEAEKTGANNSNDR